MTQALHGGESKIAGLCTERYNTLGADEV